MASNSPAMDIRAARPRLSSRAIIRGVTRRPDPFGDMPAAWAGILTPGQWQLATAAIGRARLDELRGMLAEVGEPFRAAFVRHLARLAPDQPAGAAVMLAIAHAAHDTRDDRQA